MTWISVKKKPIPIGKPVLVTNGHGEIALVMMGKRDDRYFSPVGFGGYDWEYDFYFHAVTHWMLAPKPKKKRVSKKRTPPATASTEEDLL